jgi:histidinol-phosphate aminotransferase
LRPRPEIEHLKPCPHGSIDYAELAEMGISPDEVIDFSVCLNPFPLPGIKKALNTVTIEQYPDSEVTEFRQCLAEKLRISPDNILAGSGTTELIRLIALAYFRTGDSVLIVEPTFGEYEIACQIAGATPMKQWLKVADNFTLKTEETVNLIRKYRPRGVFICNPNNPTGKYLSRNNIEIIQEAMENELLILDEAYINFVDDSWSGIDLIQRGDVVILRSMTKDYALTGLRLGYAVASQDIIGNLRRVCPPWNVNVIAQKAGIIALRTADYLETSRYKIKEAAKFLVNGLQQLGFHPLKSDTHYFLVKVGNAKSFRTALLKSGILVRDCASFGLPEYVRIAPRTIPECQKLVAAIDKLKKKGLLDTAN